MSLSKRIKNEREFEHWEETTDARKYRFDILGKSDGYARYVKYVNDGEIAISFFQEVYDGSGIWREIHEAHAKTIMQASGRIAAADVKEFGLLWEDYESIMLSLGFTIKGDADNAA
jgi:hypothetical protein